MSCSATVRDRGGNIVALHDLVRVALGSFEQAIEFVSHHSQRLFRYRISSFSPHGGTLWVEAQRTDLGSRTISCQEESYWSRC